MRMFSLRSVDAVVERINREKTAVSETYIQYLNWYKDKLIKSYSYTIIRDAYFGLLVHFFGLIC